MTSLLERMLFSSMWPAQGKQWQGSSWPAAKRGTSIQADNRNPWPLSLPPEHPGVETPGVSSSLLNLSLQMEYYFIKHRQYTISQSQIKFIKMLSNTEYKIELHRPLANVQSNKSPTNTFWDLSFKHDIAGIAKQYHHGQLQTGTPWGYLG